jgi:hypothetical protein
MLCRERPYKALTPNITFWMNFELLRRAVITSTDNVMQNTFVSFNWLSLVRSKARVSGSDAELKTCPEGRTLASGFKQ